MSLCYIYVALAAYNTGYLTLELGSVECVVDEAANVAISDGMGGVKGSQVSYASGTAKTNSATWKGGKKDREKTGKRERRNGERRTEWRTLYNVSTDAVMDGKLLLTNCLRMSADLSIQSLWVECVRYYMARGGIPIPKMMFGLDTGLDTA